MKNLKKILSLVLIASTIVIYSCSKEAEKGEDGPAGVDGNANVKSILLTATFWNWDSGSSSRYQTWTGVTDISEDIAATGVVLLYQLNPSGTGYYQLPITAPISSGVVESDYFEYGIELVQIIIQNSNLSDPISQIPTPTYYKLVTMSSTAKLANPYLDYSNYEEVKKVFNLE